MKNKANLFNLEIHDAVKGFILAVITIIITMVYQSLEAGSFPVTWSEWKVILIAGAGAGLSYIIKNFLTNSKDKFLVKEKK